MKNLIILIASIALIIVSVIAAVWKAKSSKSENSDKEQRILTTRLILVEVFVTIVTVIVSMISIQVEAPTNYSDSGGIMEEPDGVISLGDYRWPTEVWYTYDETVNPVKSGIKYAGPFIPTQTGDFYYKARFLWAESPREHFYVQTYEDRIKEAGISEGSTGNIPVPTGHFIESDGYAIPTSNPGLETIFISQSFMDSEDDPPGEIIWGWGDTTDGGQGRESYTVEDINNGLLGDRIVFNSISNSTIGDEKNFVAARIAGENTGIDNVWQNNLIEVEPGNEYIIRLFGHNNSPYGYNAIAEDVAVEYKIPEGSGRTIVVNGLINSSNAEPDRYWDSVVFTCRDRFHLEYVEGSALLESNGIGADGGLILSDTIVKGRTYVGFDALDGRIPGCFKYDFYITIEVKVVGDE